MKRNWIIISLLVMIATLATACAQKETPTVAPEADTVSAATYTLVFIPGQLANPSQAFGWKIYQRHAADYGFEVTVLDGKGDVQEQTKSINNAVAQGVDVMKVNPNDAAHLSQTRGREESQVPLARNH